MCKTSKLDLLVCGGESVRDRVLFFVPSFLHAHVNTPASSPWVMMEAALSGERNYG